MNKLIAVGIIIALSVNATIMVVGFGYLHNEINQLKNQEPDLPETPTPTEPEQTSNELTETTEPQPTLPEPAETKRRMNPPEANLTADVTYDKVTHDHLDVNVEGFIINLNSSPVYNVSINLNFSLTLWRFIYPAGDCIATRTISVGTLTSYEPVPINASFKFIYPDEGASEFEGFNYTVNWDESSPEMIPESNVQEVTEPAPPEATEPENSELKHEMMAPEVNITAEGINDKQTYDHLDINFQGTIVNPNSRPIYNVSITLEFHLTLVQMIYPTPNPYHNPTRTITLERMFGNQVVQINESFEEKYTHTGYYKLNYFTYTVNWNETK